MKKHLRQNASESCSTGYLLHDYVRKTSLSIAQWTRVMARRPPCDLISITAASPSNGGLEDKPPGAFETRGFLTAYLDQPGYHGHQEEDYGTQPEEPPFCVPGRFKPIAIVVSIHQESPIGGSARLKAAASRAPRSPGAAR